MVNFPNSKQYNFWQKVNTINEHICVRKLDEKKMINLG